MNQRVIYVGSFSKTLLPALRLGFVLSPPTLHEALQKAKYVSDWHTSQLEQTVLADFIDGGDFARHVRRLSSIHRERHTRIVETIRRDFADHLELVPSHTGLTLTALARTASVQQIAEIAARAASVGVQVNQLASFAVAQPAQAGIVLGYGGISTDQISDGLAHLRRCFD